MPRKKISKKEFVAGLPVEMPAVEVVAKGERIGVILNAKQVASIRRDLKMGVRGPKLRRTQTSTSTATTTVVHARPATRPPAPIGAAPVTVVKSPRDSARAAVRMAIIRLGIVEARQLLDDLEQLSSE